MARQLIDDSVGNVLGERGVFVYTDDAGNAYNMTQDASNAAAVGNVVATLANAPVIRTSQARPIKPRYILLSDTATGLRRKKVVIGASNNALFAGVTGTVIINGVDYQVVTRVGERQSRPRLGGSEAPAQ